MQTHLNTLYVTSENVFIKKDGAAVEIQHEGKTKLRVPLHNLDSIAIFSRDATASASLMHACASANVSLSFHSPDGKFLSSSHGPISGNVLLRKAQYRAADHEPLSVSIAQNLVRAKIVNTRSLLLRSARDHSKKKPIITTELLHCCDFLSLRSRLARSATTLERLRGIEGDAASAYFATFNHLITLPIPGNLIMKGRTRRPPRDPINALLSFHYTLLAHDCRSAAESVGLDPQCGFLHRDRPGRPSLALDLMEELRPILADRATLTLINRGQLRAADFDVKQNGAVLLKENSRKVVFEHWQSRKQSEIIHPFLREKITLGLLPHIQARLLARHLRGDLDAYPAYITK